MQSVPVDVQRCHWKPNEVGVGDQVPRETRISSPTVGVPLTDGFVPLTGPDFESTTSVGFDVANALPSVLPAVTTTRIERPTSAEATGEVWFVALEMSAHARPSVAQRRHW